MSTECCSGRGVEGQRAWAYRHMVHIPPLVRECPTCVLASHSEEIGQGRCRRSGGRWAVVAMRGLGVGLIEGLIGGEVLELVNWERPARPRARCVHVAFATLANRSCEPPLSSAGLSVLNDFSARSKRESAARAPRFGRCLHVKKEPPSRVRRIDRAVRRRIP